MNGRWIACYWRECLCLPDPGETWEVSDLDDFPWRSGQTLRSKGVIDRVERSEYGQPCTYETNREAWERIQEYGRVSGD